MKIAEKNVVEIHYTLKNDQGETLDSSAGRDPLLYLHGAKTLVPGLEKTMEGKEAGDKFEVTVLPEDGYGKRDESLTQVVDLANFGDAADKVQVGVRFQMPTEQGVTIATIVSIEEKDVTVDLNHPLADVTLNFAIEVVSVREATEEEMSHGHVHGPGCNH